MSRVERISLLSLHGMSRRTSYGSQSVNNAKNANFQTCDIDQILDLVARNSFGDFSARTGIAFFPSSPRAGQRREAG